MGLRVFEGKHQASRAYENEFFRAFATTVSAIFDSKGYEGILLGHPRSLDKDWFKPDALLITHNSVLIVDFKNFDNVVVHLPDESSFASREWSAENLRGEPRFVPVKGGASENPFAQLQKQSKWLKEILNSLGSDVPVLTRVLFTGDVRISGKIPGRFQAIFGIANGFDYPDVIADCVNITSKQKLDIPVRLLERFEVSEYTKVVPLSVEDLGSALSLAQSSKAKQLAASLLESLQKEELRLQQAAKQAEIQGRSFAVEQRQFELAKAATSAAQKEADRITNEFDEKKHALELAKEVRQSNEAIAQSEKQKSRRAQVVLATIVVSAALFGAIVYGLSTLGSLNESQMVESKIAGNECIRIQEVDKFIEADDVCVKFEVGFVRESNKFVFLQDKSYGLFTSLIMSKSILTLFEAESSFLNKTIEVRGDITEYEGEPQIKIYDISQISFVD
jgi:hypothetical protein